MSKRNIVPTGVEAFFGDDELIVSKTDLQGRIVYANDIFLKISGYSEEEIIGSPHNVIRHPDMPRAVFKLLWDTLQKSKELFAYIVNLGKDGSHYWVYAHVTPSVDAHGNIVGYHSNRRTPDRQALGRIQTVYRHLLNEEKKYSSPRQGLEMSYALLNKILEETKMPYEEYIWTV